MQNGNFVRNAKLQGFGMMPNSSVTLCRIIAGPLGITVKKMPASGAFGMIPLHSEVIWKRKNRAAAFGNYFNTPYHIEFCYTHTGTAQRHYETKCFVVLLHN